MVVRTGEDTSARSRGPSPQTFSLSWGILLGVLLLAFGATVFTLNQTLYSASGFASSYLDALKRHDLDGALAMPGVEAQGDAATALLVPEAMGTLTSYSLVSDEDQGAGMHLLAFDVVFAGDVEAEAEFMVERAGARLGLFVDWRFAQSPLRTLEITPLHDAEFDVNGVTIVGPNGSNQPYRFQVLTPGFFTLSHESKYLVAQPVKVVASTSLEVTAVAVDIQASAAFVDQVTVELSDYLDECTTQQVLQPSNCPFGQTMNNRIEGLPAWSMAVYPVISILPGDEPGSWLVPQTPAAAHLTVEVRSLFDGSLSTFDEDVPFTIEYLITFPGDGSLLITPR